MKSLKYKPVTTIHNEFDPPEFSLAIKHKQSDRIKKLEDKNLKLTRELQNSQDHVTQLLHEKDTLQAELEKVMESVANTKALMGRHSASSSTPFAENEAEGNAVEENLQTQLDQQWELLFEYEKENQKLKSALLELREKFAAQAEEMQALERHAVSELRRQFVCPDCEDQHSDKCNGPALCGKTVLYVGGLHKMIPRYKQVVEQLGGNFLHHDGGRESSRHILPKLLPGADAVFCPIDCISHDACKRVKKICKQYSKPFVMMRSSGLSSLAKGLQTIIQ